jgi:hypothetical protein
MMMVVVVEEDLDMNMLLFAVVVVDRLVSMDQY